jgi:hypothetical protein
MDAAFCSLKWMVHIGPFTSATFIDMAVRPGMNHEPGALSLSPLTLR